jgi:Homeodomain-like domain
MFAMHRPAVRQSALDLAAAGVNDCEIARRLGLPRTTVRDIRHASGRPDVRARCPRCWRPARPVRFTSGDYAELLGLYLGDGHIADGARTQKLRLSLDARYPTILADAEALLRRCFPRNRIGRVVADGGATVIPHVHHAHLSCLFPQAGSGKKHERPIVLEPWQEALVDAAPWSLLRGLIRSDGCVFINRTGRYEYLSYHFANLSEDILELFVRTCHGLGLHPRRTLSNVRLTRREDVARLLVHVGRKT